MRTCPHTITPSYKSNILEQVRNSGTEYKKTKGEVFCQIIQNFYYRPEQEMVKKWMEGFSVTITLLFSN